LSLKRLRAELPVQGAVLDGLGHVGCGEGGFAVQVGDGAGDFQDAGVGSGLQLLT